MRIYMNYKNWSFLRSTDHKIRKDFLYLQEVYGDISFYYPKSFLHDLFPLMFEFYNVILHRLSKYLRINLSFLSTNNPYMWVGPECDKRFDVVQTAGYVPICSSQFGILWECILIDPKDAYYNVSEIYHKGLEKRKKIVEKLLKRYPKILINVRSNRSVEFAKQCFPKYADKFINLPFLLPNVAALSVNQIANKFTPPMQFRSVNKKSLLPVIHVLFVGAQAKRKGLDSILDGFELLSEEMSKKFMIHIVSGFTDYDYKERITQHKYSNRFYYYGELSHAETLELYKSIHVYMMLSQVETYGLTYIEAMANGCVLVTRDKYPQMEFTENGRIGFFANPNDVKSVTRVFENIYSKRSSLLELALLSQKKFNKEFSIEVVRRKWYNAYKNLQ